jgi:hypothetical protein
LLIAVCAILKGGMEDLSMDFDVLQENASNTIPLSTTGSFNTEVILL